MSVIKLKDFSGGIANSVQRERMRENQCYGGKNWYWDNGFKSVPGTIHKYLDAGSGNVFRGLIEDPLTSYAYYIAAIDNATSVGFYYRNTTLNTWVQIGTQTMTTGYNVILRRLNGVIVAVNGQDRPVLLYDNAGTYTSVLLDEYIAVTRDNADLSVGTIDQATFAESLDINEYRPWFFGGTTSLTISENDGVTAGNVVPALSSVFVDNEVTATKYGNNILLVGGNDGQLVRSTDDGDTFSVLLTTPFGSSTISSLGYGNSVHLSGDRGSVLSRSINNGQTWSTKISNSIFSSLAWASKTASAAQQWSDIAWSEPLGIFCAISADGTIMTSPDGETWTSRTAAESGILNSVCWSDFLSSFCIVASSGTTRVQMSEDGITWTGRTAAEANSWKSVVSADTLSTPVLVAVSSDGTNRVMTSPDGETWTSRTAAEANSWESVTFSATLTRLCAVSSDGTNRVMTSPDGETWTSRTAAEANSWQSITRSEQLGLFCAVSTGGATRVMTSPDGITWTGRTAAEANFWVAVTWSDELSLFFAISLNGTNRSMYSYDGITWTSLAAAEGNTWSGLAWSKANNTFCAVSTDGTNRVMILRFKAITSFAYGNNVHIATSFNGGCIRSTDSGVSWSSLLTTTFSVSEDIECSAFGAGTFVLVGEAGKINYSTDNGATWSAATSPFGSSRIYALIYANGYFFAAGEGGKFARSADGIAWGSLISTALGSTTCTALAYGNGFLILLNTAGNFSRSDDNGDTWGIVLSSNTGTGAVIEYVNRRLAIATTNETNTGFYAASFYVFSKLLLSDYQIVSGSPVAAYEYWNGSEWTTLTLTTSPSWSTAGEKTIEFLPPTDWVQYNVNDISGLYGYYAIAVRFTTAPTGSADFDSITVIMNRIIDSIFADGEPDLLEAHGGRLWMSKGELVSYSPFNSVSGWQTYFIEYFPDGGDSILRMISFKNALYALKKDVIWQYAGSSFEDFIKTKVADYGITDKRNVTAVGDVMCIYSLRDKALRIFDGSNSIVVSDHIDQVVESFTTMALASNNALIFFGNGTTTEKVYFFDPRSLKVGADLKATVDIFASDIMTLGLANIEERLYITARTEFLTQSDANKRYLDRLWIDETRGRVDGSESSYDLTDYPTVRLVTGPIPLTTYDKAGGGVLIQRVKLDHSRIGRWSSSTFNELTVTLRNDRGESLAAESFSRTSFSFFSTKASCLPQGTFETDLTGWSAYSSDTGIVRSNEQAHGGTWSMKIPAAGATRGKQATFALTHEVKEPLAYGLVFVQGYYYVSAHSTGNLKIQVATTIHSGLTVYNDLVNTAAPTVGSWVAFQGFVWAYDTGSATKLLIYCDGTPTMTFYVDDITAYLITEREVRDITPPYTADEDFLVVDVEIAQAQDVVINKLEVVYEPGTP